MSNSAPTRSRRRIFRVVAVLFGVLPLLLAEVILALLGLGTPGSLDDPLAGFSEVHRLFEEDPSGGVFRTAPSRGLFFGEQTFALEKPAGGFRIFCLGGSTVRGRPFTTETSFTKWLELELAQRLPGRAVESVNCGGLSYASYRLRPILQEVLEYQPDLIIVATGHNEFLEDRSYRDLKNRSAAIAWIEDRAMSLRTVTLAREMFRAEPEQKRAPEVEARLDQLSGYASYHRDDQWRVEVVDQYEVSLRKMITACRDAGVPLLLVRLGSNLRDCPPFKSEHRQGLSTEEETRWQRAFDLADLADQDGKLEQALDDYHRAKEIDDKFALLAWRIARVLDRLGRYEDAAEEYRRARDLDICPLRMVGEVDQRLVTVARDTGTPLVDAATASLKSSRQEIPGYDRFMDHVHPTIHSHQQIAGLIVEELVRIKLPEGIETGQPRALRLTDSSRWRTICRDHFRRQGPAFFTNGARRVGWLENWAQRQRLDEEVLPVDWSGNARSGFRLIDFDNRSSAWNRYQTAIQVAPESANEAARVVLQHAGWLFEQGRADAAGFLVEQLAELERTGDQTWAPSLGLASLVLAVEAADAKWAGELLRQFEADWKEGLPDVSGWSHCMPDVITRAKTLAAN